MGGYNKHIKLFFNEETHLCQECVDLRISIEREVVRKFNE
jgi:hypothetical protein